MKHARSDYDAIQPFMTRRSHHVKADGVLVMDAQLSHPPGRLDPIIPDDEPVFLIRGQDLAAIPAAEAWCEAAASLGTDPEVIAAVQRHIELVREWQVDHAKVPDAPAHVLR